MNVEGPFDRRPPEPLPDRAPPPRWPLLPPDVLVVLQTHPMPHGEVVALFRPNLGILQMDLAMVWARARATEYALGCSGDTARDGTVWAWDNFHAIHVLIGRRAEINGGK